MAENFYVEKRHYDALFSAYNKAKVENANLKKAWTDLRTKTAQFNDRVLDDIHRFDSLAEENAYIIGSFATLMAIKHDVKELEVLYNVEIDK